MPHRPLPRARPQPPPGDETFACRHFGVCGGCSLLDQPVRWQLADKVAACERLLAPFLGGQRVAFDLPTRPQRHFRTRLLYPVRRGRDGRPITGLYEFRTHNLVRIEECQTQDAWLTEFGRAAETVLQQVAPGVFGAAAPRGAVKGLWARLASGSGEVVAGVVTSPGPFPAGPELARALHAAAAALPHRSSRRRRLVGIVHSISDREDQFLLGDRHVPLLGRDHVVDERDGLTFRISAGSFYQIHAGAHAILYRPALAMCGDVNGRTVIDAYGGVGAFGLRLARAGAASVTIVEDHPAACRDAQHNIAANGIATARVLRASFPTAKLPARPDLLIVDPPRSGLMAAGVARALAIAPARLLYVACAADALARDLAPLTAGGYRLAAVRLCDLFPHTEHVELVALLERCGDGVSRRELSPSDDAP